MHLPYKLRSGSSSYHTLTQHSSRHYSLSAAQALTPATSHSAAPPRSATATPSRGTLTLTAKTNASAARPQSIAEKPTASKRQAAAKKRIIDASFYRNSDAGMGAPTDVAVPHHKSGPGRSKSDATTNTSLGVAATRTWDDSDTPEERGAIRPTSKRARAEFVEPADPPATADVAAAASASTTRHTIHRRPPAAPQPSTIAVAGDSVGPSGSSPPLGSEQAAAPQPPRFFKRKFAGGPPVAPPASPIEWTA